ncbi:lipid-A-disaccharide synthase [Coraliomargarita sinensis]|uniref:Lipid-A-disaccharide synthase n=1 Tax=Coraliomargarita sinensis TaxID=2174842 RepID=A0A317ZG18_9BACT|nr:lipid-A-disaccharide synthase [Coraliomargarita sinensis]
MTSGVPALPEPVDRPPDLLIVAGEHSGDEHAAHLVAELKAKDPELKIACLGGEKLQAAGAQLLYDLTAVSIVGFVEVLKHYNFFKALFHRTLDWIEQHPPKQICFVDYPGFNLRLADQLFQRGLSRKAGGKIELSYYIGPQIWAWKAKRRFKMAKLLDRVGVIFPFEVDCYKDTDLPVEFVGHPFVQPGYEMPFVYDAEAPILLLPGSRSTPVSRIFPVLLDGFAKALDAKPDLLARVIYPSRQILDQLKEILTAYPKLQDKVSFHSNEKKQMPASAVLMSSGTMSLSVALSGIPGAIAYRLHPISYWMGRYLVKVPYIGIANLLLDRPLHKEYIQGVATPSRLADEILEASSAEAAEEASRGAAELMQLLSPDDSSSAVDWLWPRSDTKL